MVLERAGLYGSLEQVSHHQRCLVTGTSEAGLWHQGQPVLPFAPVQPEEAADAADEVCGLPSPGPWQPLGSASSSLFVKWPWGMGVLVLNVGWASRGGWGGLFTCCEEGQQGQLMSCL